MIRRNSFVGNFLHPRTKTAKSNTQQRWVIIETNDGERILARKDENIKDKKASKYQDFDSYIALIYPKAYAEKYVLDSHAKNVFTKSSRHLGNLLRAKIANLNSFTALEFGDISNQVYAAVNTKELADLAKTEGYQTEDEAKEAFIKNFESVVKKENSFDNFLQSKISSFILTAVNPYRKVEEFFHQSGLSTATISKVANHLIEKRIIAKRDFDPELFKLFVEASKESNFEYKEGFKEGFSGKPLTLKNKNHVRGYFYGRENSFEYSERK